VVEIAHDVLEPGDRLFCITDGVVDSHRPGGDDFGEQRLVGLLSAQSRASLDARRRSASSHPRCSTIMAC